MFETLKCDIYIDVWKIYRTIVEYIPELSVLFQYLKELQYLNRDSMCVCARV